ncbi:MAG: hypothetical protein IJF39_04945 [Clostridia bacterium]|nr:hypothetical protein [Clostridia bacterium]
MKIIKCQLLLVLVSLCFLLGGCGFLPSGNFGGSQPAQTIDNFEFITDEKLTIENFSDDEYYKLVLYAGEEYQIKTTVDDQLGEDYYIKYVTDDDIDGKFTLSEDGKIETNSALESNETFVVDAELYQTGFTKRIKRKYLILSILVGEYATVTLTNDGLEYDENTSTYSLAVESGNSFSLSYTVSYNTAYIMTFSLADPNDAPFISVDDQGRITTSKVGEDKACEIVVRLTGANGMLDVVFLQVTLKKSADFINQLTVVNKANAQSIQDGDVLTMYKGTELAFDIKYNNELKTQAITVGSASVLQVNNDTNTLKATDIGTSEVVFAYADKQITVTVNVVKDHLTRLYAENEGVSFLILNDTLYYLDSMYAAYQSGTAKVITDKSLINTRFYDKNQAYKTVVFTYAEDGEEVSVTYDIKYYTVTEYEGQTTAYDNNDYFANTGNSVQVLPNKGTVKMLVIPVWFNDSNLFFNESQKEQIIEDIEYTVNGNRPSSELKSLKQYYEAQSYGAITMDITVSEFYHTSTSYQDYTDNIEGKVGNVYTLGTNAIEWYFANYTEEKFEEYDLNGDGYLDGAILYYASNYYGADSDKNRTTAFSIKTHSSYECAFNTLSFCPVGGLYGLDYKKPTGQLTSSDLSATYSNAFIDSARTTIHEVGHMFGNVDLYEDQFADERYSPAGSFIMQDRNYGSHDPYHVNRIGWSKPDIYASNDYQLGEKITILLDDFQSSGQNIILTNTWNSSNSLYDEYLIVELFAPVGINEFDSKVTFANRLTSGIRVWHVNSILTDVYDGGNKTSQILNTGRYELSYSNNDVTSEFDLVHLIRNNPNEPYNTGSGPQTGGVLFEQGDSFDMQTFKSQFINEDKLDNGEKLGWAFTVERIYENEDGTYSAVITLERTDNTRTEFSKTVALNRSDLAEPDGEEEYGEDIFGTDGEFSLVYKYVTPPSVYEQGYPISSKGMCLFASADGNGGYIQLTLKDIDGKEVRIDSISVTYSKLTNASLSVFVDGNAVDGQQFEPENDKAYGFTYEVNASSVRIQNQYNEEINHWSIIALLDITIHYTIL